jgi:hypothetical protein
MFGLRAAAPRRAREEGEKPFWISFSDLMSALMVLFLVAMSVALLAVTKQVSDDEKEDKDRSDAIAQFMGEIRKVVSAKEFEGIQVTGTTIDFGTRGTFDREGQNTLSPQQRAVLRQFTPELLSELRKSPAAMYWFKRAVVEGYSSQTGQYLFNLNLSLERSARVLCELLRAPRPGDLALTDDDRQFIANTFFVGGASFNSPRAPGENSRRIEFKLEFKSRQERREEIAKAAQNPTAFDAKPTVRPAPDPQESCPLVDK